ncbi:peptidoglycan-binding domain-containing protein [Pontivivens ytuae]|uniref:Peptidoglycan-binding protein n=1 Tax=Pontivivens ytuae TaxID=2789856 RepID=A0A7S9LRE3_9RHOB|nr:peptidoglycan-binding domain-containing protein [Pontivivens ytuae]QPH53847.1 peptidoglycan-binding protein [Pontivivens ytuae]
MTIRVLLLATAAGLGLSACGLGDTRLPERVEEPGAAQPVATTDLTLLAAAEGNFNDGPPDALPGQCYAQATRPARFETRFTQVVDQEATERFEVIPATYRTETVPVVVEEAYTRVEVIPAVYDTVTETVVVEPAREETVTVPAEFREVIEQVPSRPAYRAWEPSGRIVPTGSNFNGGRVIGNRTLAGGSTETLVEYPATFETVRRQELVRAESTRVVTIPAVTREVTRRVVVEPARTVEVVVPAVTRDVERRVVDRPEQIERIEVPATFRTVEEPVQVQPADQVWVNVLCDTAYTRVLVRDVQRALRTRGFYNGGIDGVVGPQTRSAIRAYQLELGYDTPALTMEALQDLGITS